MSKKLRNIVPVGDYKRPGSNERIFSATGEITASNKRDILSQILALAEAVDNGSIDMSMSDEEASREDSASLLREEKEKLTAAYASSDTSEWMEIGATVAGQVFESATRTGFMRRVLNRFDMNNGEPKIRVENRTIEAVIITGMGTVDPQIGQDKYIRPKPFHVDAKVKIGELEILEATDSILDSKYNEGLEGVMVTEDRYLRKLMKAAAETKRGPYTVGGNLSLGAFNYMRRLLSEEGTTPATALMTFRHLEDLSTGDFANLDMFTQREIISTGAIANYMGTEIITDGYRKARLRVLEPGEFFLLPGSEYVGGYADNGPLETVEIKKFDDGTPARGWILHETLAMAIGNVDSVIEARTSSE